MSATNEFGKLDHRIPIARATTNRIGAGWDAVPVGTTVRNDPASHMPLTMPGGLQPQPLEPPPPPPTETELREVLAQALASRSFAQANEERAKASHDRALEYARQCQERVASYADLDQAIADELTEQLRGEGIFRPETSPLLRQRQTERDIARTDATATDHVRQVLVDALHDAQHEAQVAQVGARRAAVAVMAREAERLAQRVVDLEDEAERTRVSLIAFDRVSASTEQPLPAAVFAVVVADSARLSKPVDSRAWEAALDQLLGDAQAEVVVTIPERRPPPPVLRYSNEVIHVQPIRRPQAEQEAEAEAEPSITLIPEPGED